MAISGILPGDPLSANSLPIGKWNLAPSVPKCLCAAEHQGNAVGNQNIEESPNYCCDPASCNKTWRVVPIAPNIFQTIRWLEMRHNNRQKKGLWRLTMIFRRCCAAKESCEERMDEATTDKIARSFLCQSVPTFKLLLAWTWLHVDTKHNCTATVSTRLRHRRLRRNRHHEGAPSSTLSSKRALGSFPAVFPASGF